MGRARARARARVLVLGAVVIPRVGHLYTCGPSAPHAWVGDRVVVLAISVEQRTARVREAPPGGFRGSDFGYETLLDFAELVSL